MLDVCISTNSPDIICITEVLPKNSLIEATAETYQIRGYNLVAYNFKKRGICIYSKPHISITVCDFVSDFDEYIWCSITCKNDSFLLGCIYRSPSSEVDNDIKLCSMIRKILDKNYKDTVIVGDFNFGCIDWNLRSTTSRSIAADLFLDTIGDLFLEQLVSEPTRVRNGQRSSLLDLVLTNNIFFVDEIVLEDPIGKSDHVVVNVTINVDIEDTVLIERRLYYKGDYISMRNYFNSIDWVTLLCEENTQNSWDIFYDHFKFALNEFIPVTTKPIVLHGCPWINSDVRSHIKNKRKSFNKYYRRPTKENWLSYTIERNLSSTITNNARQEYEHLICVDSKQNPKTFWKYINGKVKKHNQLVAIKDSDGILCYDDISKAKLLNDYFASVFTVDQEEHSNDRSIDMLESGIGSILFTSRDILKYIDKLNCSKASGPDGIHSKIIKECSDVFSSIFYVIFHKSMKEGILPSQWKDGNVRALFKKGKKNVCSNYRPVSLTSVVCKLFESLIRDALLKYLETNHKITVNQYGFRPGYSCSSQLLDVTEDFTNFVDLFLIFILFI